jgi:hypothetical protein
MSSAVSPTAFRHRAQVLKTYRDFVDVVRRSRPASERDGKLAEVRATMRGHAAETDQATQQDLLKQLVGRAQRPCTLHPAPYTLHLTT